MKEVKIQIPDNCELLKDGDSYVVREKRQNPPRSWEEFCERYPIQKDEAIIDISSNITRYRGSEYRNSKCDKSVCTSFKEAEAFLALMQLRQLRKAWVKDLNTTNATWFAVIIVKNGTIMADYGQWSYNYRLTFPTKEMAEDFLSCFRDLCETAKILL